MDQIIALIRQVIITANEFDGEHVHIGNSDVKTAFDVMRHEDQVKALRARGVTSEDAWRIARELAGTTLLLEVPGLKDTEAVPQEKGGVQGGTLTPDTWNLIIEDTLEEVVQTWEDEGYGVRCGEAGRLTHIVWADNFWLLAKTREELARMQRDVTEVLEAKRLWWKPSSLMVMSTEGYQGNMITMGEMGATHPQGSL